MHELWANNTSETGKKPENSYSMAATDPLGKNRDFAKVQNVLRTNYLKNILVFERHIRALIIEIRHIQLKART